MASVKYEGECELRAVVDSTRGGSLAPGGHGLYEQNAMAPVVRVEQIGSK
jgi:hypothetical protein